MKKSFLFALFILLSTVSFSQKKSPVWKVLNTSIVAGCPYQVCFYMELRNISTNATIPGTSVAVCHTISTGSSASYTYPPLPVPPPGSMTVITGIAVIIGSNSYPVSIDPVPFETIYDACSDLEPDCLTRWKKIGTNQYEIHGECLIGGI